MERRLSADGFRTIMAQLRCDATFRARLLGNAPATVLKECSFLSPDDARIVGSIVWDTGKGCMCPFDQKLVLCSSSGC